jgi:hypothetical protein
MSLYSLLCLITTATTTLLASTLIVCALVSVFARTPSQRRDARTTLTILLRPQTQQHSHGQQPRRVSKSIYLDSSCNDLDDSGSGGGDGSAYW